MTGRILLYSIIYTKTVEENRALKAEDELEVLVGTMLLNSIMYRK